MITTTTQNRMFEFWCPTSDLVNGEPKDFNYWDGEHFYQEGDGKRVPIQQGSILITTDTASVFVYEIDTNPDATVNQTGHWNMIKE